MLSHVVGMCMPLTNPLTAELTNNAYRACGMLPNGSPLPGLDDDERLVRRNYTKKLLRLTRSSEGFDERAIAAGFNFHPGSPRHLQRIAVLPNELVVDVISKVFRGLEYVYGSGRYIEAPYNLTLSFNVRPNDVLDKIKPLSSLFVDGTNLIQRGFASPLEPIYFVKLWGQFEVWGFISGVE